MKIRLLQSDGSLNYCGQIPAAMNISSRIIFLIQAAILIVLAAGVSAQQRVVPLPAGPGPLDNPLKGWCPYTTAGPVNQPYSMVYQYVSWKDLEPTEGHYAFDEWEKKSWETPLAKGKHIVFRVFIDYPHQPSGLPGWLVSKGVKQTPYSDYGGGMAPDYDDPRMLRAMERLIAALGSRYDGNPRIAFIEMGLLGYWGEWHTYPRSELFASLATQQRVLEAAHEAFPHKIIMTRYPSNYAGRQPWIGFFDDMLPEDTDGPEDWKFLPGMRRSGRAENWKRAALGGEMVPHAAHKWLGTDYDHTLKMVEKAHFTWFGPYCPALERSQSPDFIKASQSLVRRMGYEFQLADIRHADTIRQGDPLDVIVSGENIGVAPFYYPWPVELALIDAQGKFTENYQADVDIRKWLPGHFQFHIAPIAKAAPGQYKLALGIRDPWIGNPSISFANNLPRQDGWTILSKVTIK